MRKKILLLLSLLPLTALAQFERTVVMEEFTGTWCGYCPRGMVAIERLTTLFGTRFIPIAIHTGDGEPMLISTYPTMVPGDGGVPSCMLNRTGKTDPYLGNGEKGYHMATSDAVRQLLDTPAEAKVELSAQWNDAQQWDVRFDVTTTFAANSDEAPYRLALILLEDGMKGEGKSWAQVNYYSSAYEAAEKNFTDDDMQFWRNAPYYVSDIEYDHVAVNTLGIRTGIQNSIQAPIVSGQPQQYSNLLTTINQSVIQDKSRLTAVVLLLNNETGHIVNAAKADILPYSPSAISTVTTGAANAPCYDLQGRRIEQPRKGFCIKDGKKFITK